MWGDGVVVEVMMKGLPLSERNCKTQKKMFLLLMTSDNGDVGGVMGVMGLMGML